MSLKSYVKKLIVRYKLKPKKRFGQNFLVDKGLMERMVEYAEVKSDDVVVHVGAGFGFLTEILAKKAGKVVCVELDPKLYNFLREKFYGKDNVEVVLGDFCKLNFKGLYNKVVSSPPYSEISRIFFKILEEGFEVALLLLQKEFALRLKAKPGEKDYSRLTVMAYVKCEAEFLEEVSASSFYPKPKVSSMLVKITPKKESPLIVESWSMFKQTVKVLFTQKNRKLKNALRAFSNYNGFSWIKSIIPCLPYLERRVFTLKPEEICEISNILNKKFAEKVET
ncbi:MAG: 16S rRNA (adenine(1518)-N(6)/adenine(1519)-N(6))-dimethyltransferase RsmA [Candidatus Bathyarchaeota archaeon]|nr:16S rRNA (adenine(1518)-N(6)/adenine(1519)-N(6))-dimethyltransferase RsmA [Candidatus Bathyarchaeota archaeon]